MVKKMNTKTVSKVLDEVAKSFPKGLKVTFIPFPPGVAMYEGSCERTVFEGTYVKKTDYDRLLEENQKLKKELLGMKLF